MYVVDLCLWSLISCIITSCGAFGKVGRNFWISGRLELICPKFHLMSVKVEDIKAIGVVMGVMLFRKLCLWWEACMYHVTLH